MTTEATPIPTRPAPAPPSLGWALRRALLGLAIMLSVTGLAAYIAQASIDATSTDAEAGSSPISIGTPAVPLLKH